MFITFKLFTSFNNITTDMSIIFPAQQFQFTHTILSLLEAPGIMTLKAGPLYWDFVWQALKCVLTGHFYNYTQYKKIYLFYEDTFIRKGASYMYGMVVFSSFQWAVLYIQRIM